MKDDPRFPIHKLPDEPILVITNLSDVATYRIQEMNGVIADAILHYQLETLYIVVDNRDFNPSLEQLAAIISDARLHTGAGSPADPRIVGGAMIASDTIFQLTKEFLAVHGRDASLLPVFDCEEDALAEVRRQIQAAL